MDLLNKSIWTYSINESQRREKGEAETLERLYRLEMLQKLEKLERPERLGSSDKLAGLGRSRSLQGSKELRC